MEFTENDCRNTYVLDEKCNLVVPEGISWLFILHSGFNTLLYIAIIVLSLIYTFKGRCTVKLGIGKKKREFELKSVGSKNAYNLKGKGGSKNFNFDETNDRRHYNPTSSINSQTKKSNDFCYDTTIPRDSPTVNNPRGTIYEQTDDGNSDFGDHLENEDIYEDVELPKRSSDDEDIYANLEDEDIYSNTDDPTEIITEDIYNNVEDLKEQGLSYLLPKNTQNGSNRASVVKKKPAITQKPTGVIQTVKQQQTQHQKIQKPLEVKTEPKLMNTEKNNPDDFNTMPKFPPPNSSSLYPQSNATQNSFDEAKKKLESQNIFNQHSNIKKSASFNASQNQNSKNQMERSDPYRKPSVSSNVSKRSLPTSTSWNSTSQRFNSPPTQTTFKKPEDLPPALPRRNEEMDSFQDENTYETADDLYEEI